MPRVLGEGCSFAASQQETNEVVCAANRVYKALTDRKFRSGPLPNESSKVLIFDSIQNSIAQGLPIPILQFWGGSKNANLSTTQAELCEQETLNFLSAINTAVISEYNPGLHINIVPGDARVQRINHIPPEKTAKYVETLDSMATQYNGLFEVVPVSLLYHKYAPEFESTLMDVQERVIPSIDVTSDEFIGLVKNAKSNIFTADLSLDSEKEVRAIEAARDYIIYRVAEEEAGIFRDFSTAIRSFFIRYVSHYKQHISDITKTTPRLDNLLTYHTGKHGNITQPWQAEGCSDGEKIIFISQRRKSLV
jgi:hypothetical protein